MLFDVGASSVAEGLPKPEGAGTLDPRPAATPGPAEALDRQRLPYLLLAGWLHLPNRLPHCCAPGVLVFSLCMCSGTYKATYHHCLLCASTAAVPQRLHMQAVQQRP